MAMLRRKSPVSNSQLYIAHLEKQRVYPDDVWLWGGEGREGNFPAGEEGGAFRGGVGWGGGGGGGGGGFPII